MAGIALSVKLQIPLFIIICKTYILPVLLTAIRLSKTQIIIYNLLVFLLQF